MKMNNLPIWLLVVSICLIIFAMIVGNIAAWEWYKATQPAVQTKYDRCLDTASRLTTLEHQQFFAALCQKLKKD